MALNKAHTSAKASDVAKLLLLNKRRVTQSSHAEYLLGFQNAPFLFFE